MLPTTKTTSLFTANALTVGALNFLQCALDDGDGAFDTGAEAARVREDDRHGLAYMIPMISTSKRIDLPASGWLKSKTAVVSVSSRR